MKYLSREVAFGKLKSDGRRRLDGARDVVICNRFFPIERSSPIREYPSPHRLDAQSPGGWHT
jgi:hypothetical protein